MGDVTITAVADAMTTVHVEEEDTVATGMMTITVVVDTVMTVAGAAAVALVALDTAGAAVGESQRIAHWIIDDE